MRLCLCEKQKQMFCMMSAISFCDALIRRGMFNWTLPHVWVCHNVCVNINQGIKMLFHWIPSVFKSIILLWWIILVLVKEKHEQAWVADPDLLDTTSWSMVLIFSPEHFQQTKIHWVYDTEGLSMLSNVYFWLLELLIVSCVVALTITWVYLL